jgi:tetratricopeptide (TPR) repeat protein
MWRLDSSRKQGRVVMGCCSLAFGLQVLALVCTQSRGPILGLAGAAYICVFLLLILKRTPGNSALYLPAIAIGWGVLAPVIVLMLFRSALIFSPKIGVVGLAVAIVCVAIAYGFFWRTGWGRNWLWLSWLVHVAVLFAIFALVPAHSFHESFRGSPLERLTQLSGNSVDVRQSLWETGIIAIRSGSPSDLPDGLEDNFSFLRSVIGYGPETIGFVASRYATPDLVRLHTKESVDRMHNETLDNILGIGLAGAALWLMIIGATLYYSLKLLGFGCEERSSRRFILLASLGIGVGVVLPCAAGRSSLVGVGSVLGLLVGVIVFSAWSGLRRSNPNFGGDNRQLFLLGALGCIIANSIETAVGIPVTSTRTYLFILMGIIAALSVREQSRTEEQTSSRNSKTPKQSHNPAFAMTLLSSFVVLALSWAFILDRANEGSALELIRQAWFAGYSGLQARLPVPGSLILLLLTICMSVGLIYGEIQIRPHKNRSFIETAIKSMCVLLAVWFAMAFLTSISWTEADAAVPSSLADEAEARIALFYVALLLLILTLSRQIIKLEPERFATSVPVRAKSWCFLALAFPFAFTAVHILVLRPVWADAVYRLAGIYEHSGDFPNATYLYDRAIKSAPHVVPYWTKMGLAYASLRAGSPGGFQVAIQSLQRAIDLNRLDHGTKSTLAGLYQDAATQSVDAAVRNENIQNAMALYAQAARLAPNYPEAYCGLGRCYFLLGNAQKAAELYEKSLKMNRHHARTHMYLGEMHFRQNNLELALRDFKTASQLERGNVNARKNLGFVLALTGRKEEAIRENLQILHHIPNDPELLCRLSALYFSQGDSSSGHTYARRAYESTPTTKRGTYEQFVGDLQKH